MSVIEVIYFYSKLVYNLFDKKSLAIVSNYCMIRLVLISDHNRTTGYRKTDKLASKRGSICLSGSELHCILVVYYFMTGPHVSLPSTDQ